MKHIIYYIIVIIIIIVLIPLLIVRGCSSTPQEEEPPKKKVEGIKVKVYIAPEDRIQEMDLEEYVKCVVAAEMPADFELETLKAQAVAARTYVYARMKRIYTPKDNSHKDADICTDHTHCQAWTSRQDAMKKWGIFKANSNWKKVERAVEETEGTIIIHDGKVINPVFHSSSGGKTENSEDVWEGVQVSYLRSVPSAGEEVAPNYIYTITMNNEEFVEAIKKEYPDVKFEKENLIEDIEILNRTEGGNVKTLRIGNVEMKGTDLRRILSLRSADFKIEAHDSDSIKITTTGYGHGVGMSQWGANHLAKIGGNYEEILKYYYSGVELTTIEDYENKSASAE
ncbi:MAG TPA: stage II sporulation protein D [Clostridiaceae bacterium]|nr:stage II sporulation protein D [Clostridiaceae bacterium]